MRATLFSSDGKVTTYRWRDEPTKENLERFVIDKMLSYPKLGKIVAAAIVEGNRIVIELSTT